MCCTATCELACVTEYHNSTKFNASNLACEQLTISMPRCEFTGVAANESLSSSLDARCWVTHSHTQHRCLNISTYRPPRRWRILPTSRSSASCQVTTALTPLHVDADLLHVLSSLCFRVFRSKWSLSTHMKNRLAYLQWANAHGFATL